MDYMKTSTHYPTKTEEVQEPYHGLPNTSVNHPHHGGISQDETRAPLSTTPAYMEQPSHHSRSVIQWNTQNGGSQQPGVGMVDGEEVEIERQEISHPDRSIFPVNKQQEILKSPYSMGHGINTKVAPVIAFTLEEEFRVMDYIVRIEQYQNKRFDFLDRNFPPYKELNVGYVTCTHEGRKIPFNMELENKLFVIGLEFTKHASKDIYEEIGGLDRELRKELIKSP